MSEFEQGYICAVATLQRAHGETTYAKDLLRCLGEVNWQTIEIDPFDRAPLEQAGLIPKLKKRHP